MATGNGFKEDKFVFDVIETGGSSLILKNYMYAKKFNERDWEANGAHYDSLIEVARKIAEDMVGTNSYYKVISKLPISEISNSEFQEEEGWNGYSEGTNQTGQRRLDREEMSNLGRLLTSAIAKRKQSLSFYD